MAGLFLIIFAVLGIILIAITIIFYEEGVGTFFGIISLVIAFILVIAIPISRLDSKTNLEYSIVLQQTIDENRINQQELNVLERTAIIQEINVVNMKISTWKIKGQKWYNNKWYYHPSVRDAQYVK